MTPVEAPFYAHWLQDAPLYLLIYLIAFGFRLGKSQIHGVVTSLWVAAQRVQGIDDKLARIDSNASKIPELDERTKRIESRVNEAAKDDSLRLTIKT